jgi:hypothetical protein
VSESFLVYDGRNRVFRAIARRIARVTDRLRLIPWRAEHTRRFLEAQFDDHLFAFVLIDPEAEVVHVGGRTIRRLLRDGGAPETLVEAAGRLYAAAGDPFGRLVHRRPPADIDGTFPLAEDARPHVASLRRRCSLAACDGREA